MTQTILIPATAYARRESAPASGEYDALVLLGESPERPEDELHAEVESLLDFWTATAERVELSAAEADLSPEERDRRLVAAYDARTNALRAESAVAALRRALL